MALTMTDTNEFTDGKIVFNNMTWRTLWTREISYKNPTMDIACDGSDAAWNDEVFKSYYGCSKLGGSNQWKALILFPEGPDGEPVINPELGLLRIYFPGEICEGPLLDPTFVYPVVVTNPQNFVGGFRPYISKIPSSGTCDRLVDESYNTEGRFQYSKDFYSLKTYLTFNPDQDQVADESFWTKVSPQTSIQKTLQTRYDDEECIANDNTVLFDVYYWRNHDCENFYSEGNYTTSVSRIYSTESQVGIFFL